MPQTVSRNLAQKRSSFIHQLQGAVLNTEAKTLFKPDCPQHAGGVIHKGEGMEHPDKFPVHVSHSAKIIIEVAIMPAVQPERQCVNCKIPPVQVMLDAAALHGR